MKKIQDIQTIMGTFVEVQIWTSEQEKGKTVMEEVYAAIKEVDRNMSHYRDDSIISMLNRSPRGDYKIEDPGTFFVLNEARRIGQMSGGAFDITIGPLMGVWFTGRKQGRIPGAEEISAALNLTGLQGYRLKQETRTLVKENDAISFDLSAIAKGYAVDCGINVLKKHNMTRALINAGGDLYALDPPPGRESWNVGIRNPFRKEEIIDTIPLTNAALATSGNYENFFELNGKKYCHIIDPRSGFPVQGVVSVTVKASSAMIADAYATTLFILETRKDPGILDAIGEVEWIMIACEGDRLTTLFSNGLRGMKDYWKLPPLSKEEEQSICHD